MLLTIFTLFIFFFFLVFVPVGHNEDPNEGQKTPGKNPPKKTKANSTPKGEKNKKKKKKKQQKEKKKDQQKADESKKTGKDKEAQKNVDAEASAQTEEKQENREIEGDVEADEQFRFLKQCWLLHNIKDLVEFRASKGNFVNFSLITDPPANVISKLLGKPGMQPLMCLTEAQKALLVPRIRLYKVDPEDDKKVTEFPFASNYSIPGTGGQDIFSAIKHSGQGVGIKEFSYDLSGTNPAEVDKLITVKISLSLASMSDLFADLGNGLQFRDLVAYRKAKKNNEWSGEDFKIRAVVGWSEPSDPSGTIVDSALRAAIRQSRVSLGLQLVQHTFNLEMDGTITLDIEYIAAFEGVYNHKDLNVLWAPNDKELSKLESQVRSSDKTELLQKEQRFINNIELKIRQERDKIGGKQVANKILVDVIKEEFDKSELTSSSFTELREVIYDNTRGDKKKAKKLSLGGARGPRIFYLTQYIEDQKDGLNERREELTGEMQKAQEELEKKRKQLRMMRYSRIVDQLHERGILYVVDVPSAEIGEYVSGGFFGDNQTVSTKAAIKERANSQGVKHGKIKASDGTESSKELKKQLKDSSKADSSDEFNSKEIRETNAYEEAANTEDSAQVHFFFLGDLYDIFIDILRKPINHPVLGTISPPANATKLINKIKILMGPITLQEEVAGVDKFFTVNLAEIPISLDLFSTWFAESIINKERRNYLLRDIMIDTAVGLISAGLEQGCFKGKRQRNQFIASPLSTPSAAGGTPRIPPHGARCRLSQISQAVKLAKESISSMTALTNVDNYMFFYGKEEHPSYLGSSADLDHSNGIYHVHVGKECGLLTSIQFKRADVKYLRESRITADAHDDEFLREKYDADITMIGNTLFFPGQYIYIKPSLPGLKPSDYSKALELGFAGYYIVITVEHVISADEYITNISAVWETEGSKTPAGRPATPAPVVIPSNAEYNCVGNSLEDVDRKSFENELNNQFEKFRKNSRKEQAKKDKDFRRWCKKNPGRCSDIKRPKP